VKLAPAAPQPAPLHALLRAMGRRNTPADAKYYRDKLDQFMATGEIGGWIASGRAGRVLCRQRAEYGQAGWETGNALRANPYLAGTISALFLRRADGVGLLNNFREFKPGVFDLEADLTHSRPVESFAEPVNVYKGGKVKFEALLSIWMPCAPDNTRCAFESLLRTGGRFLRRRLTWTF